VSNHAIEERNGRHSVLTAMTRRNYLNFYLLFALFGLCSLFYYAGELVDFAGWERLRWRFLYGVHDVHRLLFLAPILYAGYVFGARATVVMAILATAVFLPRALFISPYPDPLLRMLVFSFIAGALGYSVAAMREASGRRSRLVAALRSGGVGLRAMLDRIEDGALIVGPDYRIRFMNVSLKRGLGEASDTPCYRLLGQREAPCQDRCRLASVLRGAVETWECRLSDGQVFEASGSPYPDPEGGICAVIGLRQVTAGKKAEPTRQPPLD